jgi:hypothetical protein
VSDAENIQLVVTNHQNQPVELHLPSGLVVLPPRGQADLCEGDLAAPQLRVLCASRLITVHAVDKPPEAPDADESQPAADDETKDVEKAAPKPKTRSKP